MTSTSSLEIRCQRFGPIDVGYDARVLTPRPWTLLQSRWTAELAAGASPGPILELCAGAGQIGLAAAVLSGRDLVQVEADPVAAEYAWNNATDAGHGAQVQIRCAPMQHALAAGERFPLIVADPPYLPTADISRWPEDPVTAIDGGPDGLDLTRICLQLADAHLTTAGALVLQVAGQEQAEAVVDLLGTPEGPALSHVETRGHDAERAVMLLRRATTVAAR